MARNHKQRLVAAVVVVVEVVTDCGFRLNIDDADDVNILYVAPLAVRTSRNVAVVIHTNVCVFFVSSVCIQYAYVIKLASGEVVTRRRRNFDRKISVCVRWNC